ncbi:MAG: type II toxin-antitoxin system VapC family toxin [Bryobacteraceae bacterium]
MLLDTHVFIWIAVEPERVPTEVRSALKTAAALFISPISLTEIIIKHHKNPAAFPFSPDHAHKALSALQLSVLDYTARHAQYLAKLPEIHKDPFDRILFAQALAEGLPVVSTDDIIASYESEYESLEGSPLKLTIVRCR